MMSTYMSATIMGTRDVLLNNKTKQNSPLKEAKVDKMTISEINKSHLVSGHKGYWNIR